jgi:hypothetical protein
LCAPNLQIDQHTGRGFRFQPTVELGDPNKMHGDVLATHAAALTGFPHAARAIETDHFRGDSRR